MVLSCSAFSSILQLTVVPYSQTRSMYMQSLSYGQDIGIIGPSLIVSVNRVGSKISLIKIGIVFKSASLKIELKANVIILFTV